METVRQVHINAFVLWVTSLKYSIVQLHDFIASQQGRVCINVDSLKEDTTFACNFMSSCRNV
jgi:hypothetical protein